MASSLVLKAYAPARQQTQGETGALPDREQGLDPGIPRVPCMPGCCSEGFSLYLYQAEKLFLSKLLKKPTKPTTKKPIIYLSLATSTWQFKFP